MRLCFSIADQSFARTKSVGILNVSLGLLEALAKHPGSESLSILSNTSLTLPRSVSKSEVANYDSAAAGGLSRCLWDQWRVYGAALRTGCDWLFLPKGFASFLRRPPLPVAAYVHDAMHDFYRTHHPQSGFHPESWYFQKSFEATLRYARVIFTNSDFSRSEVLRMARQLGIHPPTVITAGIGFEEPPAGRLAKKDQIVVLAGKWPHKLTPLAVERVRRWQEQQRYAGEICLVGQLPEGMAAPQWANWRGFERMPADAYTQLLGQARALVYFSEYEGFGMPPIEAILRGTVPVYSRIAAMEESGAGCGFPFVNDSETAFQHAMNQALDCRPETLAQWARELLDRHSWQAVADRVVEGLKKCSDPTSTSSTSGI